MLMLVVKVGAESINLQEETRNQRFGGTAIY